MHSDYSKLKDLLLFVFKNKVVTTRAIWSFFYRDSTLESCYRKVLKFNKKQFIKEITVDGNGTAWGLGANGFKFIKDILPEFDLNGYGSQSVVHDLIVATIGNQFNYYQHMNLVDAIFEEELGRFSVEHLPEWVPYDLSRRPDFILRIHDKTSSMLTAIEVELSAKSTENYKLILEDYQNSEVINYNIWILRSHSQVSKFNTEFEKLVKKGKFQFLLLKDVIYDGWNAKIKLGTCVGKSLNQLLFNSNNQMDNFAPSTVTPLVDRLCFLDLNKSPQKSILCPFFQNNQIPLFDSYINRTSFTKLIN